ncbi:MAG: DNA alkylation repair protein [Thiohalorhabdus sp.]|uniref:DNA alkylation repair protein n=1 Tax=Thiohalorhabdus sp. TaxID=3094134 RepID=UPI0039806D07
MDASAVIDRLRSLAEPGAIASMAHLGINTEHALGVRVPRLRETAREIGTDHDLALALWDTGIHEARILASMVADPARVDTDLMEAWVADFNSWDLADQCCANLFWRVPAAWDKARAWAEREEELPRRAGYVLMATLALHDAAATDAAFEAFFPAIEAGAGDPRERVRKGVSWALRQIGKRSRALNARALEVAEALQDPVGQSQEAHRLGHEAERELRSELVQDRLS